MKNNISIIIPIYNCEEYLCRCIDSIINQTFKSFELILIDDGSTDGSSKICDDYALKYDNIKVIHQENSGVAFSRNVGLENANGNYIVFIDSDDYIDLNYLQILFNLINDNKADLVMCGSICTYDDKEKHTIKYTDEFIVLDKKEAYRRVLSQDVVDVSPWGKIYSKRIFDKIKYPEGEIYEDMKIIDQIIDTADKILLTEYNGYFYFQRVGSIMGSKMKKDRLLLLDTVTKLKDKVSSNYPDIELAAIKRYVFCHYHVLGRAIFDKSYIDECRKIRKNILQYKKLIFSNKIFSKKEKIATIFLNLGLALYKVMWKIFCKFNNKKLG